MIDDYTRTRLDAILADAFRNGVNLWDALDKARLLQTEAEIKKQWAQCLSQLKINIDSQPVVVFTQRGGGQNTPLDAVRGVLEYIDIFENAFAAQAEDRT